MDEMQERFRTMELQNAQLRAQIDMMAKQARGQAPTEPKKQLFQPEVEQALNQLVEERLRPIHDQYRNQLGYLADQLDQTKFQSQYGGDKYQKFTPKVEQLRQQYQAQGQYISREDALRMVYFEETAKKNLTPDPIQPAQPATPPAPVYDPYFKAYVDPTTGKPITDMSQFAPPETPAPAAPQAPVMPQQQPPVQAYGQHPPQAPNAQYQQPVAQAPAQQFVLPGQGVNQPAAATHQSANPRQALDLYSSEADLEAFENSFGDIPL